MLLIYLHSYYQNHLSLQIITKNHHRNYLPHMNQFGFLRYSHSSSIFVNFKIVPIVKIKWINLSFKVKNLKFQKVSKVSTQYKSVRLSSG
jgi:hypothetical protein